MLGTRRCVTGSVVLLVAALLLVSACSSTSDGTALPAGPLAGSGSGSPSAGPATTPPSNPPGTVGGGEVLAVYIAWWRALQSAYARGDAADPSLDDYAVDPILSRQRASIRALRDQGVVQRTVFTLQPRVRYQTDRYAEVEDACGVRRIRTMTRSPAGHAPPVVIATTS
jgi:hypothetical protein